MLTGSLEVLAGLVNLRLCNGVDCQTVQRFLQILHIVGQLCVGRHDDIVHKISENLSQGRLLLSGQVGGGNHLVGSLQRSHCSGTGIDGLVAQTAVLVRFLTCAVVVVVIAARRHRQGAQHDGHRHKQILFH